MTVTNCRQEAVALALASGNTVREASASTGVSERTIRHWFTQTAFRNRIGELRSELFSQTVGKLADLSGLAVDTLRGLLASKSENVRLGAARTVLEHAPRLREATELAQELDRLKRELSAGENADSNAPAGSPAA